MKLHTVVHEEGALGMLRGCHERIRTFSDLAVRLADAGDASPEAVRGSAEALVRYFTISFPLHTEDEDLLLAPLLAERPLSEDARDLMGKLQTEHRGLDSLLAEIVPGWKVLVDAPNQLNPLSGKLEAPSRLFREQVQAHARAEEQALYPEVARLLSAQELEALATAMRARRT